MINFKIPVTCHTNLDLVCERWPNFVVAVPSVGDTIVSQTKWSNGFQLTLEVVSVKWVYDSSYEAYTPVIELHIPKHFKWTIKEFYDWYAPKVGKSPSAFI